MSMIIGEAKKGWNIIDLYNSGARLSPTYRRFKPSGSAMLKNLIPYVGTSSLLIQVLHRGVSLPMMYQVDIMFSDVEFSNEEQMPLGPWMKLVYQDRQVWVKKLDVRKNRVKVRCSCPNEYFAWAWQGFQQGYLFGSQPKRYIRKTLDRPRVNPNNYAGICKHIAASVVLAQNMGWIAPSSIPWR